MSSDKLRDEKLLFALVIIRQICSADFAYSQHPCPLLRNCMCVTFFRKCIFRVVKILKQFTVIESNISGRMAQVSFCSSLTLTLFLTSNSVLFDFRISRK